jgi:hypothetical protein
VVERDREKELERARETDPLARIQPGRETGHTGFPPVGTVRVHLYTTHTNQAPSLADTKNGATEKQNGGRGEREKCGGKRKKI